jgi:hypothetical protein
MLALGCLAPFVLMIVGAGIGAGLGGAHGGTVGVIAGFVAGCVIAAGLMWGMGRIGRN